MTKTFCDLCKNEMTDKTTPRGGTSNGRLAVEIEIARNGQKLKVEVMHSLNGSTNAGDVCSHCILDALYRLDDRPKEAYAEPRAVGAVGQR